VARLNNKRSELTTPANSGRERVSSSKTGLGGLTGRGLGARHVEQTQKNRGEEGRSGRGRKRHFHGSPKETGEYVLVGKVQLGRV